MDERILETLHRTPLFESFHDDDARLAIIAGVMTSRTVPAGTVLIREGELGGELYVLQRGEVAITKRTLEDEEYTVTVLRDPAFFGELALLDEDKRSATIRTLQDCELLVLRRADFEVLGNAHPEIGLPLTRHLAKIVCHRFRTTNEDVILLFEALVDEVRSAEIG